jgi:hypothetical protein
MSGVTRRSFNTTLALVKRTLAHCEASRAAATADDAAIQKAAQVRLGQVEQALPSLEADVHRLGRRDRAAEAAYLAACQERLKLQRLLGVMKEA